MKFFILKQAWNCMTLLNFFFISKNAKISLNKKSDSIQEVY